MVVSGECGWHYMAREILLVLGAWMCLNLADEIDSTPSFGSRGGCSGRFEFVRDIAESDKVSPRAV